MQSVLETGDQNPASVIMRDLTLLDQADRGDKCFDRRGVVIAGSVLNGTRDRWGRDGPVACHDLFEFDLV